jgi:hypothetical protein
VIFDLPVDEAAILCAFSAACRRSVEIAAADFVMFFFHQ